jgi:hypothetical protein
MDVGYNLVERELIGKEFEEIEERMSIVEFLRRLLRRQDVGEKISVVGLDELLFSNERVASYIRDLLVSSTGLLWDRIVQFLIYGSLVLDREPKIRYRGKEIRLTPIFGNRLVPRTSGYFYSPFNI